MLAGHYAPAYVLKTRCPRVPLWVLFVAVQLVDIFFFVFAVTGVETLRVDLAARGPLAMQLVNIPFTHSLVLNLVYAAILILGGVVLKRPWTGVVLGTALFSHWFLDLFVHVHDLPLTVASQTKVGLGLWTYPVLSLLLELGLVVGGFLLMRSTLEPGPARRWADIGAVTLVVAQVIYVFGPTPSTVTQMALAAEVVYAGMIALAFAVDRHREPSSGAQSRTVRSHPETRQG